MRFRVMFVLILVALVMGCQKTETTQTEGASTTTETTTMPPPAPELKDGLQTPESVLYDSEQDVYFVSNINGAPVAADDNGFISRVNPETMQAELKWIDGSKQEVTLNAPKGMAIVGDELYVSDLTVVRRFDRRTGAPKGEVRVPGSTFLNDMAADGKIAYVSDSGMKAGEGGSFAPTGTDAVWEISGNKARKLVSGSNLNRPNGLAVVGGRVWVVTFGANELYSIDKGRKGAVVNLPKGGLDGLLVMSDGTLLVSSWDANAVYRGPATGPFTAAIENVNAPADFAWDAKRGRLLIPHFMENRVSVHTLQ